MTWFERNWKYFAFFGGLLLVWPVMFLCALLTDGADWEHWQDRELLHFGYGFALYALFQRLMLVFQRVCDKRFKYPFAWHWRTWFWTPVALVICIAMTQEFVWSLGAGWGGDFWDNEVGSPFKSFADVALWTCGATVMAWHTYFMAYQNSRYKRAYLERGNRGP